MPLIKRNISYGPEPIMKLDVYAPVSRLADKASPVVVFWHGGSWKKGKRSNYVFMGKALAAMGAVAVLPDYRKFPEIEYPTFAEDAALVIKWAHEHVSEYGGDSDRIMVMGHSAGAYIAGMTVLREEYLQAAAIPVGIISGYVSLSGPYDFFPRPDLKDIFPTANPDRPWYLSRNLKRVPFPSLIVHGRYDPIVNFGAAKRFTKRLQDTGSQASLKAYPFEHMLTLVMFTWPLRLLPGPWRAVRKFIQDLAFA